MRAFAITFLAKTAKDSQLKLIKDNLAIPENKWPLDNEWDLLIDWSNTILHVGKQEILTLNVPLHWSLRIFTIICKIYYIYFYHNVHVCIVER